MTTATVPLEDLAQRITRQQSELEALRQEYEARQAQLHQLTQRKQELEAQLREVEAEIQGVSHGGAPALATNEATSAAPEAAPQPRLGELLVAIVQEAGGRLTVKELADEVVRRNFRTTSRNVHGLVQTTVGNLIKKGVLGRAPGQPGVVPVGSSNGQPTPPPAADRSPGRRPSKGTVAARTSQRPQTKQRTGQPPLRVVLTDVLRKSKRPLGGSELARQVLATGYHTASQDFTSVVWAMLGQMDNVDHVSGKGYRLKKR